VPSDLDALREFYSFRDFAHFIEVYLAVVDLLRAPEDIRLLTYEVATDMAAQNIRYAELTLTPWTSVKAGIPIEAFVEAVEDARVAAERDHGIVLRWIYDVPGEFGLPSAEDTLGYALDGAPDTLVGFGLGGPEVGVERPQFADVFARARAAGLHSVPHAGETTGPQTVWDALRDLGAERIGHGTSVVQDAELVAYLREHAIPLEVCPTSNVATRAVARLEDHPIREMYDAGLTVTVNSDDPPMFGTTLNREYEIAAGLLGLDRDGIADLARNAVRASFMSGPDKSRLLGEIDDYAASPVTGGGAR
jgi:aminodeoxyfutalosine deaminase